MSFYTYHRIWPADAPEGFRLSEKLEEDGYLIRGYHYDDGHHSHTFPTAIDFEKIIPEQVQEEKQNYLNSRTPENPLNQAIFDFIGKFPVQEDDIGSICFQVNHGIRMEYLQAISKAYPDMRFLHYIYPESGHVISEGYLTNGEKTLKNGDPYVDAVILNKNLVKFSEDGTEAKLNVPIMDLETPETIFVTATIPAERIREGTDFGYMGMNPERYEKCYGILFREGETDITYEKKDGTQNTVPAWKFNQMHHEAKREYAEKINQTKCDIDPRDWQLRVKRHPSSRYPTYLAIVTFDVSERMKNELQCDNGKITVIFADHDFHQYDGLCHHEGEVLHFLATKNYNKTISYVSGGEMKKTTVPIQEIMNEYVGFRNEREINSLHAERQEEEPEEER